MEFKASSRGGFVGLAVVGGLLVGAAALGSGLLSKGRGAFSPLTFGLSVALLVDLAALVLMLYWSVAALRLRYRLSRNGLVIHWGASRVVVPMERIEAVVPGSQFGSPEGSPLGYRAFRGLAWPGLRVGRAQLPDGTSARLYTTDSLTHSVAVLTPDGAYVISPPEPDLFVEAWRVRRPLGLTQHWREEEQKAWPLNLPIWRERWAWWLIGWGLLVNLALHGYLAFIYERLPAMLPFHFNVLGQVDRIASRTEVLRLPQLALLMLAVDLALGFAVYGRDRVGTYLLWGGGLVVQLLTVGAVLTIVG